MDDATSMKGSSPALWNPNAAANWSLIFSPAFGAYLQARNAEALGLADEAKANKTWVYISIAYLVAVLISIFFPSIPDAPFRIAAIVILLRWYFSLGRKQVRYVKDTFHNNYQRKSFTKPLLVACGCVIGFFLFTIILEVIAQSILGAG